MDRPLIVGYCKGGWKKVRDFLRNRSRRDVCPEFYTQ